MPIARPSSIPERNKARRMAMFINPTVISFIFTSRNLEAIGYQHEAFYECNKAYSVGDGIKGKLQGEGDFSGPYHTRRHSPEVPAQKGKKE